MDIVIFKSLEKVELMIKEDMTVVKSIQERTKHSPTCTHDNGKIGFEDAENAKTAKFLSAVHEQEGSENGETVNRQEQDRDQGNVIVNNAEVGIDHDYDYANVNANANTTANVNVNASANTNDHDHDHDHGHEGDRVTDRNLEEGLNAAIIDQGDRTTDRNVEDGSNAAIPLTWDIAGEEEDKVEEAQENGHRDGEENMNVLCSKSKSVNFHAMELVEALLDDIIMVGEQKVDTETIHLNVVGSKEITLPPPNDGDEWNPAPSRDQEVTDIDIASLSVKFYLSVAMNSRLGKIELLWNNKCFRGAGDDINIMLDSGTEDEADVDKNAQSVSFSPQDSRYVTLKGWLTSSEHFGLRLQAMERFDLPDDVPVKGRIPKDVKENKLEGSLCACVRSVEGRAATCGLQTDDVILKCRNSLQSFAMMQENHEWADIQCIEDMSRFLDGNTFGEILVFRKGVFDLDQRVIYNNHGIPSTSRSNESGKNAQSPGDGGEKNVDVEESDDDNEDDQINRFNQLSGVIVHDHGPHVLYRYTILFDDLKSTVEARPSEVENFIMGEYVDVLTVLTVSIPSLAETEDKVDP